MKKATVILIALISIGVLVTLLVIFLRPKPDEPPVVSDVEAVLVEKGTFTMGSNLASGNDDERPAREVTITYDFFIGKYEVTFEEYDKFCEETGRAKPSDNNWGRGQRPVINVSWLDAIAYCNWLSEKEKLPKAYDANGNLLDRAGKITTDPSKVVGYRLPTEAEWEFAARGGNKSEGYSLSGSDNADEIGWYSDNSGDMSQDVGKKKPNELGIYDMSGNVWEWCTDVYDKFYYRAGPTTNPVNATLGNRAMRGGAYWDSASGLRVTRRSFSGPASSSNLFGFRICRTAS